MNEENILQLHNLIEHCKHKRRKDVPMLEKLLELAQREYNKEKYVKNR